MFYSPRGVQFGLFAPNRAGQHKFRRNKSMDDAAIRGQMGRFSFRDVRGVKLKTYYSI